MQNRRRTVVLCGLAWVAATSIEATLVSAQEHVWFVFAFTASAVKYGALGGVAVPVWWACERLGRWSYSPRRTVGVHLSIGIAALIAWQSIYYGFLNWQLGSLRPLDLGRTAGWQVLNAVFTYTLLVALMRARQMSRRLGLQQQREAELVVLARESEIVALKAQIRPHFLFNVLNSIYALIPVHPDDAQAMVERLADLMRHTLEAAEQSLVPLSAELASVENYLKIEQLRLGDRLHIQLHVEAAPFDTLVPPLVLQPLVENAVIHGIAPFASAGRIDVFARASGGCLELTVRDSGPGMSNHRDRGRGLALTERRLCAQYRERFVLTLDNLKPRGFEVRLSLPLETDDSSLSSQS